MSKEQGKKINEEKSGDIIDITRNLTLDDTMKTRNRTSPDSWSINLDHCDYVSIIEGLESNSTLTKLKTLDTLLNSQIIDSKHSLWGELSQSLHKCLSNASNDIFLRTLKIHHRIIAFPGTCCDGYLSLLKGTNFLLNSRHFPDLNRSRILQTFKLILDAQSVVIKFLLHANHSVTDDITSAFISVITVQSVFDWFGALDPDVVWLRNFCFGSCIKMSFFNNLIQKNSDFIKFIHSEFAQNPRIYYGNFLHYFWQHKNNFTFITLDTVESTLEPLLSSVNSPEFTNFTIDLFLKNPSLLTSKLLDVLVEPLSNINRSNIRNVLESHTYIFTVVTNVAKSPNFQILFKICNLRKPRQVTRSCFQKITDVTSTLLKMNTMEADVDSKDLTIIPVLLTCCLSIFESHPVSTIHVNPAKLIEILQNFYRLSWKNDPSIRGAILALFDFFLTWFGPSVKILGPDSEILSDLLSFAPTRDFKGVISVIGNDKTGFDFLKSCKAQIVKPYLEEIWSEDEDFAKFVFFLFVVQTGTRSTIALLSDDDDDNTVVDSGDTSATLADLVEKSLNSCGDCEEEYLGLIVMKVLVMNLDLSLYFQANHEMQEKLVELGEKEENRIVDARSSLRNELLAAFEFDKIKTELEKNELRLFLERGSNGESSWLAQARRVFKLSLGSFDPLLWELLLEQIPKTFVYRKIELKWPPSDCVYYQLHPEDFSGISLIISFGQKTGLLMTEEEDTHSDNLALLVKQSRAFLGHQPEVFSNFDWFVGIIYVLSSGDFARCKTVLVSVTNTQVTSLIWATFGKEFDDGFQENFYQHLGVVLEENCPCFWALKVLGLTPQALVKSWLNQCFFNLLKFEEICNFLEFSVLYPVECVLYYMVAVFQHLNDKICSVTHSLNLTNINEMSDLSDFRLSDYISLIEGLMKRYRNCHKF